jgi:hypothetical protein
MNHSPPLFPTIAAKLARIRLQTDLWDEEPRTSRAKQIHALCDEIALDAAAAYLDSGRRYDPATDRFTEDAPAGNQTREEYLREEAETQARWIREYVSRMAPSRIKHLVDIGCITQEEADEATNGH